MSAPAIRVDNLSKLYRVGARQQGYHTLRESLTAAMAAPWRRLRQSFEQSPDGLSGDRLQGENFWAIKDVSFEIQPGEVVGIIGRNGAGKSTLLKVLSRITEPTSGRIELRGRVGSLLEVGTGFHPELTGRENIYMNGSILGMSRREIAKKFDEIVDFSGVEDFLDTPVKRYSSGMYVRLAFAVAAHLEPEILIVDEVLAVGDSSFQKKCLQKMQAVAGHGRTILFVSHNMAAINNLCSRVILLNGGLVMLDGPPSSAIAEYFESDSSNGTVKTWATSDAPQTAELRLRAARIINTDGTAVSSLENQRGFAVSVEYEVMSPVYGLRIGFTLHTADGTVLCGSNDPNAYESEVREPGTYISECTFPGHILNSGIYSIRIGADQPPYRHLLLYTEPCLSLSVVDLKGHGPQASPLPGIIRPALEWRVEKLCDSREACTEHIV